MSEASILAGIVGLHTLAMLSPGPNVLLVIQTSMARSRLAGLAAGAGVAAGTLVWTTTVVLGLTVLLAAVGWLYDALRLAGGAYLMYLGVKLWVRARQPLGSGALIESAAWWASFGTGVLTNLSNPKAAVFFGSLFATALPADAAPSFSVAAVGLLTGNALWWHCLLAVMFSTRGALAAYRAAKTSIDRIVGGLLTVLGLGLMIKAW